MANEYEAGRAFLQIIPSFQNVRRALQREARQWGRDAGNDFGKGFDDAVSRQRPSRLPVPGATESRRQGGEDGGAFAEGFRRKVQAAARSLPPLRIGAATSEAEQRLRDLRTQLEALGDATVGVDLDAGQAQADLARLEAELQALGRNASIDVKADTLAAAAQIRALREQISALDETATVDVKVTGGAFAEGFRRRLEQAAASLPPIQIGAASSEAEQVIRDLRSDLETLSGQTVGVDVDTATATASLEALSDRLRDLRRSSADVAVKADAAAALAQLEAVSSSIDRLDGRRADLTLDVDRRGLATLDSYSGRLTGILLLVGALGPALVPLGGLAAGSLLAVGAGAAASIPAVGALALGLSGVGDAVGALAEQQTNAAGDAENAADRQAAASAQVANAQQSLASAQRAQQRAAEDGARRVADAQTGLADAQTRAARDVATAQQAVADAQDDVARAVADSGARIERAERDVADARQAAARAAEDGARTVERSLRALEDAERSAASAQRDSLEAQNALNAARGLAQDDAEDLAFRVRRGLLDEADAVADVASAEAELRDARAGGALPADVEARRVALERARLGLEQTRVENGRLAEAQRASDAAGVEGSERVLDAQQRAEQAQQRVADAQRGVGDAAQAVADARVDAARRVGEAERAVADQQTALEQARAAGAEAVAAARETVAQRQAALDQAQVDGARSIADAQRGIADAQRSSADAQISAAESVASAQRGLQDALRATEQQASTSAQKVAEAFAGLSPAGQDFARFLFSLKPELDALRGVAAANLLPGLTDAINILRPALPGISQAVGAFAGALGGLASQFATALLSPANAPFFDYLATEGPGLLTGFLTVFGRFSSGIGSLLVAFAPLTDAILDGLLNVAGGFSEWAAGLVNSDGFAAFLDYIITNMPVMAAFIGDIADLVVTLIKSMAPMGPVVLQIVGAIASFIASIPPGVIQAVVTGVLGIVGAFSVLGPVMAFLTPIIAAISAGVPVITTVIAALGGPVTLIVAGIIALGAALVAAYQHSETFRTFVQNALEGVKIVALAVFEGVILPVVRGFRDLIVAAIPVVVAIFLTLVAFWRDVLRPAVIYLLANVVKPVFEGIGKVIGGVIAGVRLVLEGLRVYWTQYLIPAVKFLIDNVFGPVFKSIGEAVGERIAIVTAVLEALRVYWRDELKPTIDDIKAKFKAVFEDVGKLVDDAWTKVVKPAFQALMTFVTEDVPGAFEDAVEAIGKAWDKVKEKAKAPIRFVVETVINNGLLKAYNGLTGLFGIDPIKPLALPKGFARGGVLPGHSTWRQGDDQMVPMRRGEGVAISEAMRVPALRSELLTWNAIGLRGGTAALARYAGGKARGGVVGEGFAKGGLADLLAFGRLLRGRGFQVSENKALGDNPRPGSHSSTGYHYKFDNSGAIDVNAGAGESKAEQRKLDPVAAEALRMGFGVQWMSPNHYNHLHADIGNYVNVGNKKSLLDKALGGIGNLINGALDFVNPFDGLVDKLRDNVLNTGLGRVTSKMMRNLITKATTWAANKARDVLGFGEGDEPANAAPRGGFPPNVNRWRSVVAQALGMVGQPLSLVDTTLRRLQQESGGNPRAINLWDINARNGIPSKGLMQVIDPTFRANAFPGYNRDIYDPLSNILASMRYALGRYGSLSKAYNRKGGYATGGVIGDLRPTLYDSGGWLEPGLTMVNNATGKPEPVLTRSDYQMLRAAAEQQSREILLGDLIVRDSDDALVGRMRVEARGQIRSEATAGARVATVIQRRGGMV